MNFLRITTVVVLLVCGAYVAPVDAAYGYYGPRGAAASSPIDAAKRDLQQVVQQAQELFAERGALHLAVPLSKCLTNVTQKVQRLLVVLGSFEHMRSTVRTTAKDETLAALDDFVAQFDATVVAPWGNDDAKRKVEGMRDVLVPNITWTLDLVFSEHVVDGPAGHAEHAHDGYVHAAPAHKSAFWPHVGRLLANSAAFSVSMVGFPLVNSLRNAHQIPRIVALLGWAACGAGSYFFASNAWYHLKAILKKNSAYRFFVGEKDRE